MTAAERAVVGAALRNPDVAIELTARLPIGAFTDSLCAAAWRAMTAAVADGAPTDVVSIAARISAFGKGVLADPSVALFELTEAAIEGQADWHAALIEDAHARSRAKLAAQQLLQHLETTEDLSGLLEHHRNQIDAIPGRKSTLVTAEEMFNAVLQRAEEGLGARLIESGWSDFDHLVNLRAGQLVVVAARPSIGKSTVLTDIARHVGRRGQQVLMLSAEMTHAELGVKMVAAQARVDSKALYDGDLDDRDWERISAVAAELTALTVHVDDKPHATLGDIRALARRLKPQLIAVDYLQLMHAPGSESRQQEVATISRGLKIIAKEYDCVVLAAAQLNRAADQRHSKTPVLSDLRESGSIEADADTVILLHREDFYERESPRAGEIDLIVAKQRGGSTGVVTLGFDGVHSRLVQLAFDYQQGEYTHDRHLHSA